MAIPPTSDPEQQDRLQLLLDSVEIDAIYMLDISGHVLTWNRGAEINKGYQKQEILGKSFHLFFTPEDLAVGLPDRILAEATLHGRKAGEGWRVRKNGERFWASFVLTAMHDHEGALIGFSKVIRDLTERKRQQDALLAMQAALQEERDRFYAAAESSLDALFICQAVRARTGEIEDFVFIFLNSNVQKLVSLPIAEMLGGRMCELLPVNRAQGFFERYKQVVLTGQPFIDEYLLEEDGIIKSAWLRVQAVKLHDGVAITVSDITERKRNEQKIEHLAQYDQLTGLPNRNLLDDRIRRSIAHAVLVKCMVGFLLIDLDGFKLINDTLGHSCGDQVLCAVARRFGAVLRTSDSLIRIGGDEFVVIIPEVRQLPELIHIVDKLLNSLRSTIRIGQQKVDITCSIGIAVYPDSAVDPAELFKRADLAMYASKSAGKNGYKFYGRRVPRARVEPRI